MLKILILSMALVFTACQKKSDDSNNQKAVDNSIQSQLGQKVFQQQAQKVANPSSIEGMWQRVDDTSADSKVTVRAQIEKNKITLAVKCDFLKNNEVTDTLYVGVASSFEYTDKTLTILQTVRQKSTANDHFCEATLNQLSADYEIDASTAQMKFCKPDKSECSTMTKIAD